MPDDPAIAAIRAVRQKISREHGNDPRQLCEYYMKYQEQFSDRLIRSPLELARKPDDEESDDAA